MQQVPQWRDMTSVRGDDNILHSDTSKSKVDIAEGRPPTQAMKLGNVLLCYCAIKSAGLVIYKLGYFFFDIKEQ